MRLRLSGWRVGLGLIVWWSCLIGSDASGAPAESLSVRQFRPVLKVQRAPGAIKVDGDLSDPGWKGAQPATNFTEHSPGEEVKPPVDTKVYVTYDDENLYLSAVCYANPAEVRASMCEREGIFSDDNIGLFFDTYGDASRAYIINLNPYGIQYDALWTPNNGEDSNFDLVFESSGKITDSGYQVEAAIPFKSLRFPKKPIQEWKFEFYRHHLREVHYSMSWATYDNNESCWPCQWGTVQGIENVVPGRGLELLPSFVAHQSGAVSDPTRPDASFDNGDVYGDFSLGGKYALASDAVIEAAYNPDFSQIEADASQVDVNSTFALSYSEKRPFFQEGTDLFQSDFYTVYTRSINDPNWAAKFSGSFGKTSVAVLSAHDMHTLEIIPLEERSAYVPTGESFSNLMAVRHSFGKSNSIGAVLTDRRYDGGGSGTLATLNGRVRLAKSLNLHGQVVRTFTTEPDDTALTGGLNDETFDNGRHTVAFDGESYSGDGQLMGLDYDSRIVYAGFSAYQRTPTYRADNGFQPRNADRRIVANGQYHIRPAGTIFHHVDPGLEFGRIWNNDGIRKEEWLIVKGGGQFRFAQAGVWAEYSVNRERLEGTDFKGIWSLAFELWATPLPGLDFDASITHGHQVARYFLAMGRETTLYGSADIRLFGRVLIEPNFTYTQNRDPDTKQMYFCGYIARTRLGYQFTRELSMRLVGEYNDFSKRWSVDPLISYRINPLSTFYLGATYDYDRYEGFGPMQNRSMTALSERQFFMKIQYLFQT
jgi:hypothetical protein